MIPIRWHYIAYGSKRGQQSCVMSTPRQAAENFFALVPNARACIVREWRVRDQTGELCRQFSFPGQRDPLSWENVTRRTASTLPDSVGAD